MSDVIIFGAGGYAKMHFEQLNAKYSPVAFCDNNVTKHGTVFCGLPVLSFDDVQKKYPDCLFNIVVTNLFKPEIVNMLLTHGVSKERIIDVEPVAKYKSCPYLESYMYLFDKHTIGYCCQTYKKNEPRTFATIGDYEKDLQKFFSFRAKTIEELNAGITNTCTDCVEISDMYWFVNKKVREISFSYHTVCNFKCTYCVADLGKASNFSAEEIEKTEYQIGFFQYLKKQGVIDDDTTVISGSGELTVHPLCDKILDVIQNNPILFYTNASVFNKRIFEILQRGKMKLCSSLDSGTRETFYKIKGVDFFDRVCENLIHYSNGGLVEVKYIILPGVNDNIDNIDGFVSFLSRCNKQNTVAAIARENSDTVPHTEQTNQMIAQMIRRVNTIGLECNCPDFFFRDDNADAKQIVDDFFKYGEQ